METLNVLLKQSDTIESAAARVYCNFGEIQFETKRCIDLSHCSAIILIIRMSRLPLETVSLLQIFAKDSSDFKRCHKADVQILSIRAVSCLLHRDALDAR